MINLDSINPAIASLAITATIDTALCVGAGGSSGSLADQPIVRTAEGKLLIPASQFKGRLRHECEKLARGLGWNVCDSPKAETMCPQRNGFSDEEEAGFQHQYQADEMAIITVLFAKFLEILAFLLVWILMIWCVTLPLIIYRK